jgi:hypothetical protein
VADVLEELEEVGVDLIDPEPLGGDGGGGGEGGARARLGHGWGFASGLGGEWEETARLQRREPKQNISRQNQNCVSAKRRRREGRMDAADVKVRLRQGIQRWLVMLWSTTDLPEKMEYINCIFTVARFSVILVFYLL